MQRRTLLAALTLPALGSRALAQTAPAWPQRPLVRFVAGFPAGGLADVIARLVAQPIGDALGTTLVVENRTGASGTIGADAVAKAPADGYTLAVSHAIPFGFAPGVLPSIPYDPVGDFTHLGMLAEAATVMVVRAASPLTSMAQALDTAKRSTVTFGSSGVGSAEHILGAVVARAASATNLTHVPYRGTPPALQDLLAGQIDILNAPITTLVPMLRDGTLRLLVTSTARRLPAFPNVPTMAELGFPQATMTQWIGVSAPRGLPAPIAARITSVLPTVLALPQVKARLEELASSPREPVPMGAEFTSFVAAFRDNWVARAKENNIVAI
jgi:tripartite-type tricarboxylate transporter receptor subunit TctC